MASKYLIELDVVEKPLNLEPLTFWIHRVTFSSPMVHDLAVDSFGSFLPECLNCIPSQVLESGVQRLCKPHLSCFLPTAARLISAYSG